MKKIIAVILSLVLVLGFAGCTANNGGETSYADMDIAAELTSEEYGIGFRKGSDLTEKVNSIMDELKKDNVLQELAEKYKLTLSETKENGASSDATVKDIEYITANGKMIIGITDYAPMNYKDENNQWTGFDTEFAQKVCEKLGVTAEFVEIDWDNKFIALESKVIDCIWNGMTISEEVLKNTSCSNAYVKNAQVVVMAKDKIEEYKDVNAMKSLTFAVEAGSAGATAAKDNGFNYVEAGTQTDALLEVKSGSCDACIIDITMANAMLGK